MNASLYSSSYKRLATSAGFTLIELMVTLAVLAIIVSLAAPSIGNQLANQRLNSTTSTLSNALKEAKAESNIRRQAMTLSYNNSSSPRLIEIRDPDSQVIATYSYDAKSTIKQLPSADIIFEPSKRVAVAVTYTICDASRPTTITPRQVKVSKLANISNQLGASC